MFHPRDCSGTVNSSLPFLINNEGIKIGRRDVDPMASAGGWNFSVHFKDAWVSIEAVMDINDKGQVVGFGKTKGGKLHAFLLNPIE